jgi:hypothetical protein
MRASLRAARIAAAISKTRLRPLSTNRSLNTFALYSPRLVFGCKLSPLFILALKQFLKIAAAAAIGVSITNAVEGRYPDGGIVAAIAAAGFAVYIFWRLVRRAATPTKRRTWLLPTRVRTELPASPRFLGFIVFSARNRAFIARSKLCFAFGPSRHSALFLTTDASQIRAHSA